MAVNLNNSGYSKQFISDEIYLNNFFKVYSCLENESRLTQKEKISLMQYPENIVKEAIEHVLDSGPNKPIDQLKIYCLNKLNQNNLSWYQNKNKTLIRIALAISALAIGLLYYSKINLSKDCVEGFYDEWGCATCENGKWMSDKCLPNYEKYSKLVESCARESKADGCFHGNYYRELSSECKENPKAALCDGNYDYVEWHNQVKSGLAMFNPPN
jgi:hypothetical protein